MTVDRTSGRSPEAKPSGFDAAPNAGTIQLFECSLDAEAIETAYPLVAGDGHAARAIRQFAGEFPVLAGLAVQIPALRDAASKGGNAEESYSLLRATLSAGFRSPVRDAYGSVRTGPLPDGLLESLRGLKIDVSGTGSMLLSGTEIHLPRLVRVLDLARRLPPGRFPTTKEAYGNMVRVASFVAAFETEEYLLTESPGRFAFEFSDEEIGAMLADAWRCRFEEVPGIDRIANRKRLDGIGRYGVSLAETPADLKGDLTPEILMQRLRAIRLEDLKEALVRDGLSAVVARADKLARSHEDAELPALRPWSM